MIVIHCLVEIFPNYSTFNAWHFTIRGSTCQKSARKLHIYPDGITR